MTFQLSDRAKELIPKARIMNRSLGTSSEQQAMIRAADDEGRYLTNEELEAIASPINIEAVQFLRDHANAIVTDARQLVLQTYPGITEPGGDLYPAMRAEACWRDFWHFLRCITYGVATHQPAFTSDEGLGFMNQLYQELKVPLPAMVTGLEALKRESLKRLSQGEKAASEGMAAYFDHLIVKMKQFT